MNSKHLLTLCILLVGFSAHFASAKDDNKTLKQVETQVEQLRDAMISGDAKKLKEVTASELNYGHSGGHVDNQDEFIAKLVSGDSDFVTIELKDQTIQLVNDIAIVRHTLIATTNDHGKPADVNIGVMLVWQKQHGNWKLLARQAFKAH
jgi:ketosteroid isomerase-like protein